MRIILHIVKSWCQLIYSQEIIITSIARLAARSVENSFQKITHIGFIGKNCAMSAVQMKSRNKLAANHFPEPSFI